MQFTMNRKNVNRLRRTIRELRDQVADLETELRLARGEEAAPDTKVISLKGRTLGKEYPPPAVDITRFLIFT